MSSYFVQTSRQLHNDYERPQNVDVILASKYTGIPTRISCGCTVPRRPAVMDPPGHELLSTHLGTLHYALASLLSPGTEVNGTTKQISPEKLNMK